METHNQTIENVNIFWKNENEFDSRIIDEFVSQYEHTEIIRKVLTEGGKENRGRSPQSHNDQSKIHIRLKTLALKKIEKIISDNREKLYELICVKFEYCKLKRSGSLNSDGLNLSLNIIDGLISFAIGLPIPLSMVIYYLVKNRLIDKLCNC